MSLPNPAELISQMAIRLKAHLEHRAISEPRFIGIRTGGVWVAQALLEALGSDSPLGTLDVSFYRDDFSQNGLHPQVRPSALPFEIEGQHLVLIDDVLMSGRTIRAAMNELFDYGRPASVTLVCGSPSSRRAPSCTTCPASFGYLAGCARASNWWCHWPTFLPA